MDGQFQDATEPVRYNCFKLDVLELLGICSLVIEENFTKTKSLNHFNVEELFYFLNVSDILKYGEIISFYSIYLFQVDLSLVY